MWESVPVHSLHHGFEIELQVSSWMLSALTCWTIIKLWPQFSQGDTQVQGNDWQRTAWTHLELKPLQLKEMFKDSSTVLCKIWDPGSLCNFVGKENPIIYDPLLSIATTPWCLLGQRPLVFRAVVPVLLLWPRDTSRILLVGRMSKNYRSVSFLSLTLTLLLTSRFPNPHFVWWNTGAGKDIYKDFQVWLMEKVSFDVWNAHTHTQGLTLEFP